MAGSIRALKSAESGPNCDFAGFAAFYLIVKNARKATAGPVKRL